MFYLLAAVVFNPIDSRFEKGTWVVIDIAFGILFLLSILILDSAPFETALKTPNGKKVTTLTLIAFGIVWTLVGAFVIYNSAHSSSYYMCHSRSLSHYRRE